MGGGTGTAQGDVYFTNIGPTACSLSGTPISIALVRVDGSLLQITPQQPDQVSIGLPVTLLPGAADAANLAFNWSNWCGTTPGPLRVEIMLPGGDTVTGPLNGPPAYDFVPRCDEPSAPSGIEQLWGFASPAP
jgi:hypothetical protein